MTLADIAAQARVSEATVSRVLNGRSGVADTTRHEVLAALDVLGFERPRRLRQHSAGLTGLVLPELTNPIFPAFAQVIEQVLAPNGYTPVLCTQVPGGATEDELVGQLEKHGVTGIVFLSGLHADTTADTRRYAGLAARGVPFVLINGSDPAIAAPAVSPDDRAAARMAVRHLAELGHERIGLAVGPLRYVPARRKAEGFAAALHELFGPGSGPPLTTVRQPVRAMAGAAVDALLEGIKGAPVRRTEFVVQPELVVRGSTAQVRPGADGV